MSGGQAWPADAVVRRPLASLVPYAKNARTHSETQVAQLARLIAAYGWTNPVLVDEAGSLIAGHGRVLAAQSLGLVDVPVMVARGWTADQVRAYRLADNASAAQAGWDDAALKFELGELDASGFDLDLTGFAPDELAELLGDDDAAGTDAGSLAAQFGIPPFTVLNAREGWWQDRKRAWLGLGIQSELGRGNDGRSSSNPMNDEAGTLVIDTYRGRTTKSSTLGHKANAIPGGAGKNSVVRDMGRRLRAQT